MEFDERRLCVEVENALSINTDNSSIQALPMKQCSKRDGENMRNKDVNEDRVSQLPDALLLQILSLLPTKVAVSTSVLSKQWQSLWKMLPNLNFKSYVSYKQSPELGTSSENVRKALLSNKAPVLESLHLKTDLARCNAIDTEMLIGIALARNVRKLILEVEPCQRFIFPKSFYNCETLETLEVKISVLMDVPSSVCLKSLRTLNLYYVDFTDRNKSVLNLLSGCPNLENLEVHGTLHCTGKPLTIAVPSLQRLSIVNINYIQHVRYAINTPSLKHLKIKWIGGVGSCVIENAPMLLEASITNDTSFILGSLTSVKRLSLEVSALEIPFPTGIIFYQLVYLELCIIRAYDWCNLLTLMLDTCPNLQVLKLIGPQPGIKGLCDVPLGKWNQPNNVPQCLETFVWKNYEWRANVKEVTKYILSNASRLEKATFFRKLLTSKERVAMAEELEKTVIKASSSCQLLFK